MIVIVGAGALGSHVALFLRNLENRIKVVDFDRVEGKNVLAQFHTKMGMRKNKAQALSQALQGMFGITINPVPHKLSNDNVNTIIPEGATELVIDCTDNIESRKALQLWCGDTGRDTDIPCLHGSLSADGTFARVMWSEHFVADAEGEEGEATCIDGEHLPFFAAAAAYMAIEAQRFLKTGKKQNLQLTPAGIIRLA